MDEGKERTKRLVAVVALAVGLAVILGVVFSNQIVYYWCGRAFPENKLRELSMVAFPPGEGSVAKSEVPYRTGKVLIVNRAVTGTDVGGSRPDVEIQAAKIDRDWARLDSALRAASPAEVETVIVCKRKVGPVGVYVPKGASQAEIDRIVWTGNPREKGHQYSALLEVYDLKQRILVGSYTILGAPPPPERTGREDGKPADVAEFVAQMPAR